MSIHLISTRAVERTCQCGYSILAAVDEGLPAKVDSEPINPTDEITALVDGRRTYAHTRTGELIHRSPGRIRIGLTGVTIHAEHRCAGYHQPSLPVERIMT